MRHDFETRAEQKGSSTKQRQSKRLKLMLHRRYVTANHLVKQCRHFVKNAKPTTSAFGEMLRDNLEEAARSEEDGE